MTCTETDWAELDAVEARREYDERNAPVATLADAHHQWHSIHGADAVCDLDCGAGERDEEPEPEWVAAWSIARFFDYADRAYRASIAASPF